MFSSIIGLAGTIASVIGIICWFSSKSIVMLLVGVGLYAIETVLEWKDLNANAKKMDVLVFFIGCLIGWLCSSAPWYVGGLIALCGYSAIMGLIGFVNMLLIFF